MYVTVGELRAFLVSIHDDETNIKINGTLVTDMYYHEITGVSLA